LLFQILPREKAASMASANTVIITKIDFFFFSYREVNKMFYLCISVIKSKIKLPEEAIKLKKWRGKKKHNKTTTIQL